MPTGVFAFAGGDGSPSYPYQVATAAHLDAVRNHLGAHFRQTADIDLGVAPWNEGAGWVPIGTATMGQHFTGHYDGGGHTIANLRIGRPGSNDQGLFGYLNEARIGNVTLTGAHVSGRTWAGILAGRALNSEIEAVSVEGHVSAAQSAGGGVLGAITNGALHRAHATVNVSGNLGMGGLVGTLSSTADIRHSSVRGTVTGTEWVGGIVAYVYGSLSSVSDCYSHAAVTGDSRVGGLIGYLQTGNVYRSFSTGLVTGPSGEATIGGLVGEGTGCRDSFWDLESSGQPASADGEGLTSAQMRQAASFRHFNFHCVWEMTPGGYPEFRDFAGYAPLQDVPLASLAGAGTEADPYLITNASELHAMRADLSAFYRLANDIELRDAVLWDMGRGWLPVGSEVAGERFAGGLDGAGFVIRNLVVNRPQRRYQALFGYAEGATVKDLRMESADVQSLADNGLFAGFAVNCRIEKVETGGILLSANMNSGGLAGVINGGLTHRVRVIAIVRGGSRVGGLAGAIGNGAEIRHASVHGSMRAEAEVGGLVGFVGLNSPFVSDAYSRASVSGDARAGGLAGYILGGDLYRCYSAGMVSGPPGVATIGGGVGEGHRVRDSFWDTEASGLENSAGGEGLTTAQMHDPASFRHFNFHTLWEMEAGGGYPVFRDFSDYAPPWPVDLATLEGNGTAADPYIVSSAVELHAMRQNPAAHYRMANDIDLRDSVLWDMGRGWTPVGVFLSENRFRGGLDGDGFAISHLVVNRPAEYYQGLFGVSDGASIRNLRLRGSNVQAGYSCGLLAGRAVDSTVESVSVEGVVVSGMGDVGGLIGQVAGSAGSVRSAWAEALVFGNSPVGGLVGHLTQSGQIHTSFSQGTVRGNSGVGGLVGMVYGGVVADCYSRAAAGGEARVGGLIGYLWTGAVHRSHSSGRVEGPDGVATIGGLIGEGSNAERSYWNMETSGKSVSGGGEGRETAEMTHPNAPNTYVDWDFSTVWTADPPGRNGGYPYFAPLPPAFFINAVVEPPAGGTVTGSGLRGAWTTVAMAALPQFGYHFLEWREAGETLSTETMIAFEAREDREITALFQLNKYAVVYDWSAGGVVTGELSQIVEHGSDGTPVTAEPDVGYAFVQWSDGLKDATRKESAVTGPLHLSAEFDLKRYTLAYPGGAGGGVLGPVSQIVPHGGDGAVVIAEADPGALFHQWSDGSTANPRIDLAVTDDIEVTALFRSLGGVDVAWYAGHGICPGPGQSWADLDGLDWGGKGRSLREEFIAQTDPNNPLSHFVAGPLRFLGSTIEIFFSPSHGNRRYTLWRSVNLSDWTVVPGQAGVAGGHGPLIDPLPPAGRVMYRVEVAVP